MINVLRLLYFEGLDSKPSMSFLPSVFDKKNRNNKKIRINHSRARITLMASCAQRSTAKKDRKVKGNEKIRAGSDLH